MKEVERRGMYSKLQISSPSDVTSEGISFTYFNISYEEKGEKKRSHFYLAKHRGRLLKIRLTAVEPVDDGMLKTAFSEACASIGENG